MDEKILNLAKLVDYQKSSTVSRILFDKKAGKLTVFAFDEGQSLSEHTSPYDAIVQVLEGKVEIQITKQLYQLEPGEMIHMPANQPHALRALSRFKMLLILIR